MLQPLSTINFKKNSDLYFLNLVSIIFYFLIFSQLSMALNSHIMFSTHDSLTYYRVSNWLMSNFETKDTAIRPFLYPLLIDVIYKTTGPIGLWLFQFFGWLTSINLLFFGIKKITTKKWIAFLGATIMMINISFLIFTLHALTEIVTIALLSYLIFYTCSKLSSIREIKVFQGIVLVFVLLAVTKPLFFPPLIFLLVIILPLFYGKIYFSNPKKLINLGIILIPLIFQMSIMFFRHDTFNISNISQITIDNYCIVPGVEKMDNISHSNAQEKVKRMTLHEKNELIKNNKSMYYDIYCNNLKYNIKAIPTLLSYPKGQENKEMTKFMTSTNEIYYKLHCWMILPTVLLLLFLLIKKKRMLFLLIFSLMSLSYYIFLTSGISSSQGDRLVLPALPLWIALYTFVIVNWFKIIISFFQAKKSHN